MVLVKILKRRDASSIVVAVIVAFVLLTFLSNVTEPLAGELSSRNPSSVGDWQTLYLFPAVWAALQLLALEALIWLYVGIFGSLKK